MSKKFGDKFLSQVRAALMAQKTQLGGQMVCEFTKPLYIQAEECTMNCEEIISFLNRLFWIYIEQFVCFHFLENIYIKRIYLCIKPPISILCFFPFSLSYRKRTKYINIFKGDFSRKLTKTGMFSLEKFL